jgi:hypothetical protein
MYRAGPGEQTIWRCHETRDAAAIKSLAHSEMRRRKGSQSHNETDVVKVDRHHQRFLRYVLVGIDRVDPPPSLPAGLPELARPCLRVRV